MAYVRACKELRNMHQDFLVQMAKTHQLDKCPAKNRENDDGQNCPAKVEVPEPAK